MESMQQQILVLQQQLQEQQQRIIQQQQEQEQQINKLRNQQPNPPNLQNQPIQPNLFGFKLSEILKKLH